MSSTTSIRRELAHRRGNGIDVSLFWHQVGNVLSLEVYDEKTDEFFVIGVPKDRALDAFHHPFAYIGTTDASGLLAA
jgi:hypothetical protein